MKVPNPLLRVGSALGVTVLLAASGFSGLSASAHSASIENSPAPAADPQQTSDVSQEQLEAQPQSGENPQSTEVPLGTDAPPDHNSANSGAKRNQRISALNGEDTSRELLDESFTGQTVDDPQIKALGVACLTAATGAPGPDVSDLGPCDDDWANANVSPPLFGAEPGWLMLTPSVRNQVGAVLIDRPIPSYAGLIIEFDVAAYTPFPFDPADGFSFFLTDGAHTLSATGAPGGSLGYANNLELSGVERGYLGIGFDWYGNFAVDNENKGTDCEEQSSFTVRTPGVTVRGPGDGMSGYCHIATEKLAINKNIGKTLPSGVKSTGFTTPEIEGYRLVESIKIVLSHTVDEEQTPTLEIYRDETGQRTDYKLLLKTEVPKTTYRTLRGGFSASTGDLSANHLIRNLEMRTVEPMNDLSLVKQVSHDQRDNDSFSVGDQINYQFVLTNTGETRLSAVQVIDPGIPEISCPRDTLDAAGEPEASMTCTGTYTVKPADAQRGSYTNTARAESKSAVTGLPVVSSESSVTVTISSPPIDLSKSTIEANPTAIPANGESSSAITVTLRDGADQPVPGEEIKITTTAGTVSATTDNEDGTYTATLTSSTVAGVATVGFTLDGEVASDKTVDVTFEKLPIDWGRSSISANPTTIRANGTDSSTITVTLLNTLGNPITDGNVVITSSIGNLSYVTNVGDGTYTATLTSSNNGTAIIGFSADSSPSGKTTEVTVKLNAIAPTLPSLGGNSTLMFVVIGSVLGAGAASAYAIRTAHKRRIAGRS